MYGQRIEIQVLLLVLCKDGDSRHIYATWWRAAGLDRMNSIAVEFELGHDGEMAVNWNLRWCVGGRGFLWETLIGSCEGEPPRNRRVSGQWAAYLYKPCKSWRS
jgi:hypothetical protein